MIAHWGNWRVSTGRWMIRVINDTTVVISGWSDLAEKLLFKTNRIILIGIILVIIRT